MSSAYRVRVTVEPTAVWPRTKRGVCSAIVCEACGAKLRAPSHAEARKALRFHRLDGDCPQATAVLNEHWPDVPPVTDARA